MTKSITPLLLLSGFSSEVCDTIVSIELQGYGMAVLRWKKTFGSSPLSGTTGVLFCSGGGRVYFERRAESYRISIPVALFPQVRRHAEEWDSLPFVQLQDNSLEYEVFTHEELLALAELIGYWLGNRVYPSSVLVNEAKITNGWLNATYVPWRLNLDPDRDLVSALIRGSEELRDACEISSGTGSVNFEKFERVEAILKQAVDIADRKLHRDDPCVNRSKVALHAHYQRHVRSAKAKLRSMIAANGDTALEQRIVLMLELDLAQTRRAKVLRILGRRRQESLVRADVAKTRLVHLEVLEKAAERLAAMPEHADSHRLAFFTTMAARTLWLAGRTSEGIERVERSIKMLDGDATMVSRWIKRWC